MAKAGPKQQTTSADEVRTRLIDAAIRVLARDGFARASARAIATEAGTVNGLIFYYFGSMNNLLGATAEALAERGVTRLKANFGGEESRTHWASRLGDVIRAEAASDDGRAVMELLVGSRTSEELAQSVRAAIAKATEFATREIEAVLADSPLTQLVPASLVAELATAAFVGYEMLIETGSVVDIEQLASRLEVLLTMVSSLTTAPRVSSATSIVNDGDNR